MSDEELAASLGAVVKERREAGDLPSATFWAQTLCQVVKPQTWVNLEVYTQCLVEQREFARALSLLRSWEESSEGRLSEAFQLRKAEALFGAERVEEALVVLNGLLGVDAEPGTLQSDAPASVSSSAEPGRSEDSLASSAASQVLLGRCHLWLENRQSAAAAFQAALTREPDCAEALRLLAEERLLAPTHLAAFLRRLLPTLPNHPHAALRKALYLATAGDVESEVMRESEAAGRSQCLRVAEAERLLDAGRYSDAYAMLKSVLDKEEQYPAALPAFIAVLVQLKKEAELFALAHRLVDADCKTGLSWYAVGAYYYLMGNNEAAKKFLVKAGAVSPGTGRCWLLLGHAFAMEQEHDQAISCYLKASKLLSGSHLPFLYIGMENCLSKNFVLSLKFLDQALEMAPEDPTVLNEIGVLHYREGLFDKARKFFLRAFRALYLSQRKDSMDEDSGSWDVGRVGEVVGGVETRVGGEGAAGLWEAVLTNLGSSILKSGQDGTVAVACHQQALQVRAEEPSLVAYLALALLATGQLDKGLLRLQEAMSYPPNNLALYRGLLGQAMEAATDSAPPSLTSETEDWGAFVTKGTTSALSEPIVLRPPDASDGTLPGALILEDSACEARETSTPSAEDAEMSVSMGT